MCSCQCHQYCTYCIISETATGTHHHVRGTGKCVHVSVINTVPTVSSARLLQALTTMSEAQVSVFMPVSSIPTVLSVQLSKVLANTGRLATPHHTTPYHTTPYHTTPHHATPYHTTPHQFVYLNQPAITSYTTPHQFVCLNQPAITSFTTPHQFVCLSQPVCQCVDTSLCCRPCVSQCVDMSLCYRPCVSVLTCLCVAGPVSVC